MLAALGSDGIVPAEPAFGTQPSALSTIPNVSYETYPVTGDSEDGIRQSLAENAIYDPDMGLRFYSFTKWYITANLAEDGAPNECNTQNPTMTFGATIRLPKIADELVLPEQLRLEWHRFLSALMVHENGHVESPLTASKM